MGLGVGGGFGRSGGTSVVRPLFLPHARCHNVNGRARCQRKVSRGFWHTQDAFPNVPGCARAIAVVRPLLG